jgi:hypothetical protein
MIEDMTEDERRAARDLARQAIANAERNCGIYRSADVYVGDERIGTLTREQLTIFNAGYRAGRGQDFDMKPYEPWPRERVTYAALDNVRPTS